MIEAGDEATAVMSRLQALEKRSTGAMTSVAQRFRGKEATDCKPQTWSGEKGSESFTAFKMELQNWVGSLHANMRKVMGVAEAKEGRLMLLDIKNTVTPAIADRSEGFPSVFFLFFFIFMFFFHVFILSCTAAQQATRTLHGNADANPYEKFSHLKIGLSGDPPRGPSMCQTSQQDATEPSLGCSIHNPTGPDQEARQRQQNNWKLPMSIL